MKMKLWLLRDTNAVADIERFAFDNIDASPDEIFVDVKQISSVDFDPLIPEQDINIDLGSTTGIINYAIFDYIASVDPAYPRQDMDKYPGRWFFYVTGMKRKPSSSVVTFHVKLDAVSTLSYAHSGTLANLCTNQSYIRREHRSRFLIPSSGTWTNLQYNIDKEPEGIAVPLKKSYFRALYNNSAQKPSAKWYLIYKTAQNWDNSSSGNAISLYLACSDSLKISNSTSSGSGSGVSWSSLGDCEFTSGNWYYVSSEWSPNFVFYIGSNTYNASSYFMVAVGYTLTGSTLSFDIYAYSGSPGNITGVTHHTYSISPPYSTYAVFNRLSYFRVLNSQTTDETTIKEGTTLQINAGTTTVSAVYSTKFDDIDRTDPLIVKIIESPYCPDQLNYDDNVVSPTYLCYSITGWNFDQATKLWVPSSSASFSQTLRDNIDGTAYFTTHNSTYKNVSGAAIDDVWDGFDPKLFHSDFHISKVVYDVYAVEVKLEDMTLNTNSLYTSTTARDMTAKWYISPDINSVFLLEVTPKNAVSYPSKTQDFGQFAVIDRNNEKPIFSNAYLNYMRVGYNFDQKAKSLQNWSAIAGIAISAAGTVVGAATGQAYITAAGVAGLIGSITSAAMGAAQRENSFDANLAKLKAQATSVAGSSDIAILDKYNPRCAYIEYDPIDSVKESLARLFHMFGYKTNRFKAPDFVSRSLWNYVEGDVVLDQHALTGIPQEVATRFIEQVAKGITVMHNNGDIGFDTLQKYQNWEWDLL